MKVGKIASVHSNPRVIVTIKGEPGAWNYKIAKGEFRKYREGTELKATRNEEELWSAIHALEGINYTCDLTIRTTQPWFFNAFKKRLITKWERAHWRAEDGRVLKHAHLWCSLLHEIDRVTDKTGVKIELIKNAHVKPRIHGK